MADTPWCGNDADKLYLQSGQFTSTLKTSEDINTIDDGPQGITWDGTNTPWCGVEAKKLYLTSGQFTSTIKDSENISTPPSGISWDGTNTPWIGSTFDKLYLQSGQFTSTIKDSEGINGIDGGPSGISYDGTDTPWCGTWGWKLYLQSGQFTSTIKDSELVSGIDSNPTGISWDGTNTPWTGTEAKKLYLQSGQFTSTLKDSEYVGGIDAISSDICTNDVNNRLGAGNIYEESVSNNITLGQSNDDIAVYSRLRSNNITLGQSNDDTYVYIRSTFSTILLCQNNASFQATTIAYINTSQLRQTLFFNHQLVIDKIFGLAAPQTCRQNLPRWIFASASKYFSSVATNNGLHYFVEGTTRKTKEHQKYIEFRLDGPHFTQLSKNYYRIDVEINILWSFNQDDEDFHEPERLKGILIDAMQDICIYKYGDGPYDDDSFVDTLQLKQDNRTSTRANNFGQVRKDVRLMQGTVEGTYSMLYSC